MTVLEYVARFTELARFGDDYVATDAAKVKRFEDGLKLSIRGKIVGHNLQGMDSMVSTALIIEREIENARSIRDAGASSKRKESQSSSSSGKKSKASSSRGFQIRGHRGQGQPRSGGPARTDDMFLLPSSWAYETGLLVEAWISEFLADVVPVINGTGTDTACSSSPQYGSEEPVSVPGCCTSTSCYTDRPEGSGHGSRLRTGPTGRDIRGSRTCLRHHTTD